MAARVIALVEHPAQAETERRGTVLKNQQSFL
jgi:hypothetical protein